MNKNSLDKQLRAYYRDIRSFLPCGRKTKKRIMSRIYDGIADYTETHPEADIESIRERFGAPEAIAETYIAELSPYELKKTMSPVRKIVTIVLVAALAAVMIWLISTVIMIIDAHNSFNGTAVIELEEYN